MLQIFVTLGCSNRNIFVLRDALAVGAERAEGDGLVDKEPDLGPILLIRFGRNLPSKNYFKQIQVGKYKIP
jgi:hypothetical protein